MSVDERQSHAAPEVDSRDLGSRLEELRPRLRRMVSLRLDPRLRRRIDSSDVIQESFVDVARRFEAYRRSPDMPFFVWVRYLTAQKLLEVHRRHMQAERRDVRREEDGANGLQATSVLMARAILDRECSPSDALARKESKESLRSALEKLSETDREILLLKHFEQLSSEECAAVLGLSLPGAVSRHLRAVTRLREVLREYPDLRDVFQNLAGGRGADG